MTTSVLYVAIGGMLGSVLRYMLSTFVVANFPHRFPLGTFIVNLIGCFAIGCIVGLSDRHLSHDWKLFLTVGFCGGFTTFSAFALENVQLLLDKNYGTFAAYSIASFVICIGASLVGLMLFRS